MRLTCKQIAIINPVTYQSFWKSRFSFYDLGDEAYIDGIEHDPNVDWRMLWWFMFKPWSTIASALPAEIRATVRNCVAQYGDDTHPPLPMEEVKAKELERLKNRTKAQVFDEIRGWKNRRWIRYRCFEIIHAVEAEMREKNKSLDTRDVACQTDGEDLEMHSGSGIEWGRWIVNGLCKYGSMLGV